MQCALVYDFDGTLAKGNCAEHGLMPALDLSDKAEFWPEVHRKNHERDGDEILTYLGELALRAREVGKQTELSPERLQLHGESIPLFPGVEGWFDAVNRFASDQGIALSHYIVSSGLEEMIRGTPVAKYFKKIFGCRYHYDEEAGFAKWPAVAIDYTTKTQYLFRINKGIENSWDNKKVNEYIEPQDRPFPFDRMIYFGDGDTDIPAMKMVKAQGGCSIAVFDGEKWNEGKTQEKIEKLISEDRASYVVSGDYSVGSQLDVTVRGILRLYARRCR
ncbi:HAD family hydrolase [Halomonas stenophila]|uniref:2-hydroxy-3-keto-5-methylthiopentenyl-1-phosphate phosphatase n=1 Tax=Halomonas stenophila TaxID=795312 RepID=A0A7W5EWP6_9GAMM|nr:HAD family hydrolase [Halomonas stenophila]MBB3232847.1 2-hydroxy-3-keto-5-methylthiopentenyl-1-phosphate phosphatase [Halomonas stenophila]